MSLVLYMLNRLVRPAPGDTAWNRSVWVTIHADR